MKRYILCMAVPLLLWAPIQGSTQAATDLLLVIDNSGSMRSNDPGFLAKATIGEFITQLDGDTRVGLIIFDQRVEYPVPLAGLDVAARTALNAGLEDVNYRGQRTDSPSAVERAIYELRTGGRAQASKLIVFLTDGIVDTGNAEVDVEKARWMRDELTATAVANGIRIYAIAFTENADFFLIQTLASKTGGEYFRAPAASDLHAVFASIHDRLLAQATGRAAAEQAVPVPAPEPASSAEQASSEPVASAEETVAAEEIEPQVRIADAPAGAPVQAPDATGEPPAASVVESEFSVADLTDEELKALAEAGISPDELASAEPGTAIVVRPGARESRSAIPSILGVIAVIGLGLVGAGLYVRAARRKSEAQPAAESRSPAAAVADAWLRDVDNVTGRQTYPIGDKPIMIGRIAGNDAEHMDHLVVDSPTVGRRHAVVTRKGAQRYVIVDQGSVNGTYVNDQRISGEHTLRHGDRVRFHKIAFVFEAPAATGQRDTIDHDATVVADSTSTLVAKPGAAVADRDFDRIGDTAIVAAGNITASDDAFGATTDGGVNLGDSRFPAPDPVRSAATSAPGAQFLVTAGGPVSASGAAVADDLSADASAFYNDSLINDESPQSGTDMAGFGVDPFAAPMMDDSTPDFVLEDGSARAAERSPLPPGAERDNAFSAFAAALPDDLPDAGPPTEEHDLSANGFVSTSAFDASVGAPVLWDLDAMDMTTDGFNRTATALPAAAPEPAEDALEDFDLFDVTGENARDDGHAAPRSGDSDKSGKRRP